MTSSCAINNYTPETPGSNIEVMILDKSNMNISLYTMLTYLIACITEVHAEDVDLI